MKNFHPRLLPAAAAVVGALAAMIVGRSVQAHEYWLDPVQFVAKAGDSIPIVHRNGMNFLGDSYPYEKARTRRFAVIDARGERPIKAVDGDDPAADADVPNDGLAIIAFERAPDRITHPTLAKFADTLDGEGLEHVVVQHSAEALPAVDIREDYARFAKTLIKVGSGKGQDRAVGLAFELVVEGNPYELAAGAPVQARVLHRGKPLPNVLVKAFNRADPQLPRSARSDAAGLVSLAGVPPGEVLLSAVIMMRAEPSTNAVWTSQWASVTFKRP